MRQFLAGRLTILSMLVALLLVVQGCAGLLLLAKYAAAISTIERLIDDDDGDPTYTLQGWVFVDPINELIAIQGDGPVPPDGDFWEKYTEAKLVVNTVPEAKTTYTDDNGYFKFTGISMANVEVVLTVEAPEGAEDAQFLVNLVNGTIDPYNP